MFRVELGPHQTSGENQDTTDIFRVELGAPTNHQVRTRVQPDIFREELGGPPNIR
jgi:hypothetical protein